MHGEVFTINTTKATQKQAQASCNAQGAQLVSYDSRDEQVEVEQVGTCRCACACADLLPARERYQC
jgi:hypothetical protein